MKKNVKQWLLFCTLGLIALLAVACGGTAEQTATATPAPAATEATSTTDDTTEPDDTTTEDPAATTGRCGDTTKLAPEIHFYNWSDYMDPDILTAFEEECGVKVTQDIFASNEDLIAKVQAGNSGYDLIVPSDYAVQILIQRNLLKKLDMQNIPNAVNLNEDLLGLYYDPNNEYSLPYQWGTTGIAYNTKYFETPPDSWAVLFDPEQVCQNSGFVSMLDDERETVGAALKYLGYSYNDTDPAHHAEALALLQAQKDCLAGYNSENYNQSLVGEEVYMAHGWSGIIAFARSENPDIAFVIPKEGGAIWQDNMAIPVDAPNAYTAEVFMNYLLDAQVGAQLSNYIYFFTPNQASEPLLDEEYFQILQEGGMLVTDEVKARLEWIERNEETIIFSDTWTAVKAR